MKKSKVSLQKLVLAKDRIVSLDDQADKIKGGVSNVAGVSCPMATCSLIPQCASSTCPPVTAPAQCGSGATTPCVCA